MDKNSTPSEQVILQELDRLCRGGAAPEKYQDILRQFFEGVKTGLVEAGRPLAPFYKQFYLFLHLVEQQFKSPHSFEPYHRKIRSPIDYHRFGLDFIRCLIDPEHSLVFHLSIATQIEEQLKRGENVVLLANHQAEADPQAIAILLEKTHPKLSEEMIYVAGMRVITDPLAIPFSMGCDLLCIYSKRYIDNPPEQKAQKQLHNKQTMERMSRLLSEGGKAIYVAPAGGRDRKSAQGDIEVAPFDPQSIEMFYLMAKKAKTPTHFYPFTLSTYELLPPPAAIQVELGESRLAQFTPIFLSFSPEFDMDHYAGSDEADKEQRRKNRADAIWNIVRQEHQKLLACR